MRPRGWPSTRLSTGAANKETPARGPGAHPRPAARRATGTLPHSQAGRAKPRAAPLSGPSSVGLGSFRTSATAGSKPARQGAIVPADQQKRQSFKRARPGTGPRWWPDAQDPSAVGPQLNQAGIARSRPPFFSFSQGFGFPAARPRPEFLGSCNRHWPSPRPSLGLASHAATSLASRADPGRPGLELAPRPAMGSSASDKKRCDRERLGELGLEACKPENQPREAVGIALVARNSEGEAAL